MKGPQKSCCRKYAKRKLEALLRQGGDMGTDIVLSKLRGTLREITFRANNREEADRVFYHLLSSIQNQIAAEKHYGTLAYPGEKKKEYKVIALLKEGG